METIQEIINSSQNIPKTSEQSTNAPPIKKAWYELMNELEGNLPYVNCPKCKNKGVIYYEKDGYEFSRECECMKVRRSYQQIEKSGMKDIMCKYTFPTYETPEEWKQELKNKALAFVEEPGKCFYIGGQVGCGKTHLCTAIVGQLLKKNNEVRYMQWRDDVVKIKQNANKEEYNSLVEPFKKVKVLYIDDIFKMKEGEQPTPADVNIAFEIINHRYINNGYITIISSEKMGAEIIGIDEAIGSRIAEMAGKYFISIKPDIQKNYRLKGGL